MLIDRIYNRKGGSGDGEPSGDGSQQPSQEAQELDMATKRLLFARYLADRGLINEGIMPVIVVEPVAAQQEE